MCLSPRWKKINEELIGLLRTGILSKVEYTQWATLNVLYIYIYKRKTKEIHVCTDFSIGRNATLEDYHNPLPGPELFTKRNHIYQPLRSGRIWHKVNFYAEFNSFEFRVFHSPRLVASPRLKNLVRPTHSWRENIWFHTFPKGISAMWNAISQVENLNSCRRVHILRR